MFAEAVRQSPTCFSLFRFYCIAYGYAIHDICGDASEMVCDLNGPIGCCDLNRVRNKGTCFASCAFACEGSWLIVKLECAPN